MICEHEDIFMGLHFMNDLLFEMYDSSYKNKSEEQNINFKKASNAEFKNDNVFMTKVQIKRIVR